MFVFVAFCSLHSLLSFFRYMLHDPRLIGLSSCVVPVIIKRENLFCGSRFVSRTVLDIFWDSEEHDFYFSCWLDYVGPHEKRHENTSGNFRTLPGDCSPKKVKFFSDYRLFMTGTIILLFHHTYVTYRTVRLSILFTVPGYITTPPSISLHSAPLAVWLSHWVTIYLL